MAMDGVLRLYFGESNVPTPQYIVDAAVRALNEGYMIRLGKVRHHDGEAAVRIVERLRAARPSLQAGHELLLEPDGLVDGLVVRLLGEGGEAR